VLRDTDRHKTWVNALTAGHISSVMVPLHYETDREMLDAALPTIGLTPPEQAKMLWIKNTLELTEMECSAAYLEAAKTKPNCELISGLRDLPIDSAGNLPRWKDWR
jgi:hypothetical protein